MTLILICSVLAGIGAAGYTYNQTEDIGKSLYVRTLTSLTVYTGGVAIYNLYQYYEAYCAPIMYNGGNAANASAEIGNTSDLYHYTSADPNSIMNAGLRADGNGSVFTTPNGTMSPLQAQIDLALKPNRGLPEHLFKIDTGYLMQNGYQIPDPQLIGRGNGMPGGGYEVIFPHAIPPGALEMIR
jgi:hypothetical protein